MERSDGDCSFSFSFSLSFSVDGIVIEEIDGIEFFLCFCFDEKAKETSVIGKFSGSFV